MGWKNRQKNASFDVDSPKNINNRLYHCDADLKEYIRREEKRPPSTMTSNELRELVFSLPKGLRGQIAISNIGGLSQKARRISVWKIMFRLVCCAIDTMWLRGPGMAMVTSWWSSIRRNPIARRYLRQRYSASRLAARFQMQTEKAVRDVP